MSKLLNKQLKPYSKVKKAFIKLPLIIYYRFARENPNTKERWTRIWAGDTEYGDLKVIPYSFGVKVITTGNP